MVLARWTPGELVSDVLLDCVFDWCRAVHVDRHARHHDLGWILDLCAAIAADQLHLRHVKGLALIVTVVVLSALAWLRIVWHHAWTLKSRELLRECLACLETTVCRCVRCHPQNRERLFKIAAHQFLPLVCSLNPTYYRTAQHQHVASSVRSYCIEGKCSVVSVGRRTPRLAP